MRRDIRILAILLALNTFAVNGTIYKLFVNNCEGDSMGKLIFMVGITLGISFGLAFLLQKLGLRFDKNSSEKDK